ncbi:MAG: hypothetical protein EPO65_01680 [Dehalococcoidia bacterium]|nr:MAG: hypothetical protein EPO65_01680 [Dehalococcoidia bacterium]
MGDAIPLTLSIGMASSIFWAPWTHTTAAILALSLTVFFIYWLIRSYSVGVAVFVGLRRIREWTATDWQSKYSAWAGSRTDVQAWDWPRHLVIVPNYKEHEEGLARTLRSLATQANASQVVVVLAMEAREAEAPGKADRLITQFQGAFANMFATFHPANLPGELAGKGSNEAWAAREAYSRLIQDAHDDLNRYTITSCDADAVFHPRQFVALNYMFLTARDRYRTFWQPTIFNSNNIWDIPAALRIPDGLSGINRTANLILPFSVKFPTSCYSLSWSMLHEIDYWDEEVIPEDWHVYLKACFSLGDRVHVEPIFVPVGNDCVLAPGGTFKTLTAHYEQAKRHAWGASDITYAWNASFRRGPLSIGKRILLTSALTKTHVFWVAQWYIVTLGILVPAKMSGTFGASMPLWWTHKAFSIPGPGWHPENIVHVEQWMAFDKTGIVEPHMWLNFNGLLIAICLLPLISLIIFETRTRPPRPDWVTGWGLLRQYVMWPAMGVITFFWASMPALHAQWRLAMGKGLIYKVAEKGTREMLAHEAAAEAEAAHHLVAAPHDVAPVSRLEVLAPVVLEARP